jgi:hypothetical protein
MNGFILDDKTLVVEPVKVNLKADKTNFGPPSLGGPADWNPKYVPTVKKKPDSTTYSYRHAFRRIMLLIVVRIRIRAC